MKTAGELARKYLEWALDQKEKREAVKEAEKPPAQLRAEMLEKLGIKR